MSTPGKEQQPPSETPTLSAGSPEANGIRSRFSSSHITGEFTPPVSPTSTTSNLSFSHVLDPTRSVYRSAFYSPTSANGTPLRKVTVRADPSLATCFDPSDKELYDLWAPKK